MAGIPNSSTPFRWERADTYQRYADNYAAGNWGACNNWTKRKIEAIPYAIGGVVKAIYHLAKTIILGAVFSVSCGNTRSPRLDAFRFVRDLEEVGGRILTLFHDKAGSYLVDDAQTHNQMYNEPINPKFAAASQPAPQPDAPSGQSSQPAPQPDAPSGQSSQPAPQPDAPSGQSSQPAAAPQRVVLPTVQAMSQQADHELNIIRLDLLAADPKVAAAGASKEQLLTLLRRTHDELNTSRHDLCNAGVDTEKFSEQRNGLAGDLAQTKELLTGSRIRLVGLEIDLRAANSTNKAQKGEIARLEAEIAGQNTLIERLNAQLEERNRLIRQQSDQIKDLATAIEESDPEVVYIG